MSDDKKVRDSGMDVCHAEDADEIGVDPVS
jgi:hypothetical protein